MNAINGFLTFVSEWFLAPLAAWPLLELILCASLVGVLMSLVFKYTSNQTAMARILDRSRGHILAIKLFKDDLRGMFRSLANVIRYMLLRLWYSLIPVLVMIVPLVFLMAQLFLRYEYRPLARGEDAIVQLQLKENAWVPYHDVQLQVPSDVSIETDALRDEELRSIYWRIRASAPGRSDIRWQLGTAEVEKSVVAADDLHPVGQVSQRRSGEGWWNRLWYAGEANIENSSPVAAAIVHYPRRDTPVFGFLIPWWVTFFAVSIVAALLAQPFLKVRF
jgi:hypothetical protein